MNKAEDAATHMGHLAGRRFRQTGVPSPNPFSGKGQDKLSAAWRRAYFAAVAEHKK